MLHDVGPVAQPLPACVSSSVNRYTAPHRVTERTRKKCASGFELGVQRLVDREQMIALVII